MKRKIDATIPKNGPCNASQKKRRKLQLASADAQPNAQRDARAVHEIEHPVLKHYYVRVIRLRNYLQEKLDERAASRKRRALLRNAVINDKLLDEALIGVPHVQDSIFRHAQKEGEKASTIGLICQEFCPVLSPNNSRPPVGTAASVGGGGRLAEQHEVRRVKGVLSESANTDHECRS